MGRKGRLGKKDRLLLKTRKGKRLRRSVESGQEKQEERTGGRAPAARNFADRTIGKQRKKKKNQACCHRLTQVRAGKEKKKEQRAAQCKRGTGRDGKGSPVDG